MIALCTNASWLHDWLIKTFISMQHGRMSGLTLSQKPKNIIAHCLCIHIICCEIQIRAVRSKTTHQNLYLWQRVHVWFESSCIYACKWKSEATCLSSFIHWMTQLNVNHLMRHFNCKKVLLATARQPLCVQSLSKLFRSNSDAKWRR